MASEKGPSAKLPHSKSAARSNSAPADVRSAEPVRDAWMHGKPLLFLGEGRQLWEAAGVPFEASEDPAWVGAGEADEAAWTRSRPRSPCTGTSIARYWPSRSDRPRALTCTRVGSRRRAVPER